MMRDREMKFNLMKSILIIIAVPIFLADNAWASCYTRYEQACVGGWTCGSKVPSGFPTNNCKSDALCTTGDKNAVILNGPYCIYGKVSADLLCCNTQPEADSAVCVRDGKQWIDNQCVSCTENDSTWIAKTCTYVDSLSLYLNAKTDYQRVSCDTTHNATIAYYSATCDTANFDINRVCLLSQDSCSSGIFTSASLPKDTTIESGDSTIMYECYFNCATKPNSDSTVFMVKGNIEIPGPQDSVSTGIKYNSIGHQLRSTYGSIYVYDALGDPSYRYLDSAANATCVHHMYRGTKNGKYVYWYDNKEIPSGVTNVVRIK